MPDTLTLTDRIARVICDGFDATPGDDHRPPPSVPLFADTTTRIPSPEPVCVACSAVAHHVVAMLTAEGLLIPEGSEATRTEQYGIHWPTDDAPEWGYDTTAEARQDCLLALEDDPTDVGTIVRRELITIATAAEPATEKGEDHAL